MRLPAISTPITSQEIDDPFLRQRKLRIFVLRTDLLFPTISGNKFYKLYYNLYQAKQEQQSKILTFGGAFSNHIFATATASKIFDFQSIGIIRGEEHKPLNPVLEYAQKSGMELHYVDRTSYRQKNTTDFIHQLRQKYGQFYLIPEGGSNQLAVKGCAHIPSHFPKDTDFVCCACGTGGTLAGLIAGGSPKTQFIGFSVLKGGGFLIPEIQKLLDDFLSVKDAKPKNWEINLEYHFGGYAKTKPELMTFLEMFKRKHQIPLEPIYTAKMFYGVWDLIQKDFFPQNSKIVLVHTGGITPLYNRK